MMTELVAIDDKRCCSDDGVASGRTSLMLVPSTGTELEPLINDDQPNASTSNVTLIWTKGTKMNGILLRQVL